MCESVVATRWKAFEFGCSRRTSHLPMPVLLLGSEDRGSPSTATSMTRAASEASVGRGSGEKARFRRPGLRSTGEGLFRPEPFGPRQHRDGVQPRASRRAGRDGFRSLRGSQGGNEGSLPSVSRRERGVVTQLGRPYSYGWLDVSSRRVRRGRVDGDIDARSWHGARFALWRARLTIRA